MRGVEQLASAFASRLRLSRSMGTAAAMPSAEGDTGGVDPNAVRTGQFMHQRHKLSKFPLSDPRTRKELFSVSPLLFLMALGVSLGAMTMYRELIVHPQSRPNKQRRQQLFEMEEPEAAMEMSKQYTASPLRKLVLHSPAAKLAEVQQEPPDMPGVETAVLGGQPARDPLTGMPQRPQKSLLGDPTAK